MRKEREEVWRGRGGGVVWKGGKGVRGSLYAEGRHAHNGALLTGVGPLGGEASTADAYRLQHSSTPARERETGHVGRVWVGGELERGKTWPACSLSCSTPPPYHWKPKASHIRSEDKKSAPELVQRVAVLEHGRLVERVGLDAADVVRLHGVQFDHEVCQLLFELGADRVELERLRFRTFQFGGEGELGVCASGMREDRNIRQKEDTHIHTYDTDLQPLSLLCVHRVRSEGDRRVEKELLGERLGGSCEKLLVLRDDKVLVLVEEVGRLVRDVAWGRCGGGVDVRKWGGGARDGI